MSHRITGRTTRATVAAVAANLALAAVVAGAQAGPSYLAVADWSADELSGNVAELSATTNGAIPRSPDAFIGENAIVGLAWADFGTLTAVVATIHPVIGRDSNQRPDSWHMHTVQLGGGATAPNDLCLVAVTSTPTAGISIQGATFTARIAASDLPVPVGSLDGAVGFTVHGGDAGCATGLGVRVRT